MARLAIADPPYPPHRTIRYDVPGGRVVERSRARRWYGDGTRGHNDPAPADFHPDAGEWDDPARHHELLEHLVATYDGWAIATTPDGLEAYRPWPLDCNVLAWVKPNSIPGGHRLRASWEAVLVSIPKDRRARRRGFESLQQISDVLTCPPPAAGFAGAKPEQWTRWVLDVLGYDSATDTVDDLFPGSGAVSAAVLQEVLL